MSPGPPVKDVPMRQADVAVSSGPEAGRTGPLSPRLVALLAVTAGAAVANIYYIQPLLDLVAGDFDVADSTAALLVTCTQVGFVTGIVLLVPLGDLVERRRLIRVLLCGAAAALVLASAAPSFPVLAAALVAVGTLAAVAQVVVPLASTLAGDDERGQVVGTVMSGLLIGILAARTVSGLVTVLGGWRLVFVAGAVAMLVLSVLLHRALPAVPPVAPVPYRTALRSVLDLVAREPLLRQRMALGAFGFAGFSVLWTSLAFLLSDPPYGYDEGVIGLFGLAGIAGALTAPLAGRWADRGQGLRALHLFLLLVPVSWGLLTLGGSSTVALVAGIVLLDAGMQGAHISNQAAIYRLRPEVRSRVTTAYVVSLFLGGVAGSVLSAVVYGAGGWEATCAVGAVLAVGAVVTALATRRIGLPEPAGAGAAPP
jgi:predicted MFS family arabinose efflux permease